MEMPDFKAKYNALYEKFLQDIWHDGYGTGHSDGYGNGRKETLWMMRWYLTDETKTKEDCLEIARNLYEKFYEKTDVSG